MSEDDAPERIAVIWSPEARADLRAMERETAVQILHCVDRYLASRTGDVKKLKSSLHSLAFGSDVATVSARSRPRKGTASQLVQ